jgi:S-adenosylmethionine:tRNA ribosyltransferase-isomerase
MLVSDFDYHLPPGRIATRPVEPRDSSKMLVVERATSAFHDCSFRDLPGWLRAGDLVVLNNTRVFRARLIGGRAGAIQAKSASRSAGGSGQIEALLTKRLSSDTWLALVHPGRKIRTGERLKFGDEFEAEVISRGEFGERTLRFTFSGDFFKAIEKVGHVPLPPYLHRPDDAVDAQTYQTVYARHDGSAAAPTAGLHFTADTLARLRKCGVEIAEITLHVGLGTFQPIHTEVVEEHRMHAETYEVGADAATAIARAVEAKRRIVAVGTTCVRTLEDSLGRAGTGESALFIYPDYQFQRVGAILTNFHLPKSTLLMLVCAFGGRETILNAYRHAVGSGYRFFSYGDCMLIL